MESRDLHVISIARMTYKSLCRKVYVLFLLWILEVILISETWCYVQGILAVCHDIGTYQSNGDERRHKEGGQGV